MIFLLIGIVVLFSGIFFLFNLSDAFFLNFNLESNELNIFIPQLSEKNIELNLKQDIQYKIVNTVRKKIKFGNPVFWIITINDGYENYEIEYNTPQIDLHIEERIDEPYWFKNITISTTFLEGYKDVGVMTTLPYSEESILISPLVDYSLHLPNLINLTFPELKRQSSIVIRGTISLNNSINIINTTLNNLLNTTLNITLINETINETINVTFNETIFVGETILFETTLNNKYNGVEESWPVILEVDSKFINLTQEIQKEELELINFLKSFEQYSVNEREDLFSEDKLQESLSFADLRNRLKTEGNSEQELINKKEQKITEKKKELEAAHIHGFRGKLIFNNFPIKYIDFNDIKIVNNSINLGVKKVAIENSIQSYAIDPEQLQFTEAEVLVEAKGTYLMKCEEWNFANETCAEPYTVCGTELDKKGNIICGVEGGWKKVQKIIPGEEYSFILTPDDPCFAEYNTTFTAPYCANGSSPCIAGSSLLMDIAAGEPNEPNTIDACTDGTSGSYQSDESLENITITSLNNSQFRPGDTVSVDAYAYCWNTGASDNINFVYSSDASIASPVWTVKNYTDPCPAGGFQQVSTTFRLDNVEGNHAIRVVMQYDGTVTDTCGAGGAGNYDDTDDVVIMVEDKPVAPSVYVQRGISNVLDTTSSITTELEKTMNASKSFVLFTANTNDATPDDWQYTSSMSTDGNYINFTRYSTNGATEVKWEVVQADYLDVQRGSESLLSGTDSIDVIINEVDLGESFIIVEGRCADETDADSNAGFFAGNFTNTTNILLWRGNEGDCDSIVSWQVVEWDSSYVESGVATIADNGWNTTASLSSTISNLSQTMLFFSTASIGTDQGMDSNLIMGNITAVDEIYFNHEPGTTYASAQRDITWFVVEVPGSGVQRNPIALVSDISEVLNPIEMNRSFYRGSGWGTGGGQTYSNALYNVEINESDNLFFDKITGSQTQNLIWQVIEMPLEPKTAYNCTYTKFSGSTTNFNKQPSPIVSSGTLEIPSYGKIIWNNAINITNQNFDLNVNMTSNEIWLNAKDLMEGINSSANLTLYNLDWQYPIIFNDGTYCSDCNILSYSGGTLEFSVPHFTSYTSRENANLTIWDTTDSILKSVNEQVYFYANYTNATYNAPLNGTNIGCTFSQNSSGSWSSPTSMDFNAGSGLYEYNMSFAINDTYEFNITCENTVNHANLSARDTFPIAFSVPEVNLIGPVNGYNSTSGLITTFEYNVSDSIGTIQYCELIINGKLIETNSSVVEDIPQSFSKKGLLGGINQWSVNCSNGGTESFSETWNINVSGTIFEDTFGSAGGFIPDSVNTAPWQRGTASQTVVDSCYDDTTCWGTNLVADYTASGPYDDYLVQTNKMDLRYYENLTLFFYHFRQFEDATDLWDTSVVDINNSGVWSRLTPNEGYQGTRSEASTSTLEGDDVYALHGTDWEIQTFDLSLYNKSNAKIRFHFAADDASGDEGWFIDKVRIAGDYKIDTINPVVNLDYPGVDYFDDMDQYINMTFNATVTDNRDIVNCSLYTNLTGIWDVNKTNIYSSQGGVTAEFNLTDMNLVSFIWNVKCYDAEGNYDWANTNRTATFNFTDRTPPEVYLNSPPDGISFITHGDLTFNISTSDSSGLTNCTLWTNLTGTWEKNDTKTFSGTSDYGEWDILGVETGSYEWNAYCCDLASHCSWNSTNSTFSTTRFNYPVIENLTLNSTSYKNYTEEDLTALYDVSDEDAGDSGKLEGVVDWKINGESLSILNVPFTRSSNNTHTKEYAYGLEGVGNLTTFHNVDFKYGMGIYNFTTANSVMLIPDNPDNKFAKKDDFTFMAWVRFDSVPSAAFANIIEKGYADNFLFFIGALNGGNMASGLDTGTGENDCDSGFNIADGNWHHIAATYNHTRIRNFVDGVERNGCDETADLNLVNHPWSIGSEWRPGEDPYWDSDSEVSGIWVLKKALSINEIQKYYTGDYTDMISNETAIGDVWQSCVTPNDGRIDGSTVCSNNVTVLDWLDTIPPNVSLMTPLDNHEETNTKTPSFYFNATDEYATSLTCWLNVTDYATLTSEIYATNNSVELDTSTNITAELNIPNGMNYWNVICSDGQNNKTSLTRTINVSVPDYAPPNISLMIPLGDAIITNTFRPTFYFNVTDQVASIVTCDLILNNSVSEFYAGKKNVPTEEEVNITSNTSIIDGVYDWRMYCDDGTFTAYSINRTFTMAYSDSTAPTVTILLPRNNSIEYAGITEDYNFTVVDEDNRTTSEIDCTAYYNIIGGSSGNYGSLNDVDQNENLSIGGTQAITAATEWYVNCTDKAGNIGQSETWLFNYYDTVWLDDMEPGHDAYSGNWVESATSGTESFGLQDNGAYGGDYLYADSPDSEYAASASEIHLTAPVMDLRSYHDANITFYHQYDIHDNVGNCNDAMIIEVSTDGSSYSVITPEVGSYSSITSGTNPRTGENGFCGNVAWTNELLDLGAYAGESTVYLRWTLATDASTSRPGYDLDNIILYGDEDAVDPVVLLIDPAINYINDSGEKVNVTFTCNATDDYHLRNMSLFITDENDENFKLNQSTILDGETSNETSWIVELSDGNYTWNCLAYDFADNYDWANANRTIIINWSDVPTVNLVSPIDNFVNDTDEYVNLSFSATVTDDHGLLNCSLWHNISGTWARNQTVSVSGKSDTANFDLENLNQEGFHWNIECYDDSYKKDFAIANRTVYINWTNSPPGVILSSPIDNFVNDTDEYVNLSFSATITDDNGLYNCSLWHNISGTWARNQTVSVSGKSDNAEFNLTNLNQEIFHWNVGCYDVDDEFDFAIANRTVYINWTNSVPTQDNPLLVSTFGTNYSEENLTCYPQNVLDIDGDSVKNITNWQLNGQPVNLLNMLFEGGSNSTWTRDYALGNNGTVIGATWSSTSGYDGEGAYDFEGVNEKIEVPHLNLNTNSFTMTAWVDGVQNADWAGIVISRGGSTTAGLLSTGNELRYMWNGIRWDQSSGLIIPTNIPTFVAMSLNQTHVTLYLNDNIWIDTYSHSIEEFDGVTTIGLDPQDTTDRRWLGIIDDVLIFNRSLSAEQIKAIYHNRTDLIVSQETTIGEDWECAVTPNDGIGDGLTKTSNTLDIFGYADLIVSEIIFEGGEYVEGETKVIQINVTNNDTRASDNFIVALNISFWNGTKILNESLYSSYLSLNSGESKLVEFNWTSKIGTYIFDAYVDVYNNVTESNEINNVGVGNKTVSSWETLYGNFSYNLILSNYNNNSYMNWTMNVPVGNSYFSDTDASYLPFDLLALNGASDLEQADSAMGLTGFNDSLKRLFDRNNDGSSDDEMSIEIAGSLITNIPIINSTNNSNFITGLLYDSNDGVGYDGTQDLVFITIINAASAGKYGSYDYEIRVPSRLESLKPGFDIVERLDELK